MTTSSNPDLIRVARLASANGLKGGIRLHSFSDDPHKRFVEGAVFLTTMQSDAKRSPEAKTIPTVAVPHELTVKKFQTVGQKFVVYFEGFSDRNAVESLSGVELWFNLTDTILSDDNDDDAWFDHQLIGLDVRHAGETVGKIARVDHLPGHDLLAVDVGTREVLVPFVTAIVPTVNVNDGFIVIDPPRGLFDNESSDAL